MTMPKKAFILYCPCQPEDQLIPNVDFVTLKGCSGQIVLEEQGKKKIPPTPSFYLSTAQNKTKE